MTANGVAGKRPAMSRQPAIRYEVDAPAAGAHPEAECRPPIAESFRIGAARSFKDLDI